MKKLLLLSAVCLMSFATFAQSNSADATKAVSEIASKVELSKDQKAQILSLESKMANDLNAISHLKSDDLQAYYRKLSFLTESKVSAVKELLSEGQLDEYIAYRKAKSVKRQEAYKQMEEEGLSEIEIRIKLMESM